MEPVFDEDRPALNPDGTLKDATEIEWLHSPSEAIPKPVVAEPDSPSLGIKRSQRRADIQARLNVTQSPKKAGSGFARYKAALEKYKLPSPKKTVKSKPAQKVGTKCKAAKNAPRQNKGVPREGRKEQGYELDELAKKL